MNESRIRHLLEHDLVAVGVLLLATVWWLQPFFSTEILWPRDAVMTMLSLEQLQAGVFSEPGRVGWPLADPVSLTDWVAGQALLSLPLSLLGVHPMSAYLFLAVVGLLLSGLVGMAAARLLLGRGPHTWVAGIAVGFHINHITHFHHINLTHHEAALLGAGLFVWGMTTERAWMAGLGALCCTLAAQLGFYMGVQSAVLLGGLAVAAAAWRVGSVRLWLSTLLGVVAGVVAALPIIGVYRRGLRWVASSGLSESQHNTAWDPVTTFQPSADIGLHRLLFDNLSEASLDAANPGYVFLALAGLGLWVAYERKTLRWVWGGVVLVMAVGGVMALGSTVTWYGQDTGLRGVYYFIPGLSQSLDPSRWLAVVFMMAGMLAALGTWSLYRQSWWMGALPVLLLAAERPNVTRHTVVPPIHEDYAALASVETAGPVWDSLINNADVRPQCHDGNVVPYTAALTHDRPLLGGQYARFIGVLDEVNTAAQEWPGEDAAVLFDALEVAVTFEHSPTGRVPSELATCQQLTDHRMCTLIPQADPLPAPGVITDEPTGDPVGLRWADPDALPGALSATCGGETREINARLWWLITRLRFGPDVAFVEYIYPQPCSGDAGGSHDAALIYASADTPWLTP